MGSASTGHLFLLLLVFSGVLVEIYADDDDDPSIANLQRLKDKIFKNYDVNVRPVLHHSNETLVQFAVIPLYLLDMDEEQSLFSLDTWFYLSWTDYRLAWVEKDYDNLEHFTISDKMIWQPDLTVYNAHNGNIDPRKNTHLLVFSSGLVIYVPPAQLTTYCATGFNNSYPNDEVICKVILGSWSHDGLQINLTVLDKGVYLDEFENTNPRWEMLVDQVNLTREVMYYNCCVEPYITLDIRFPLRRRPPAELEVVWSPCVLVMLLTLTMFWIPSNSGKKIALGSILFLVLTMLTVYVSAVTKSPRFPRLAVSFISSTMYAIAAAMVLEVVVLNMSGIVGPCRPPEVVVKMLCGVIGKCIAVWPSWVPHVPGDKIQLKEDGEQMIIQPTPKQEWLLVATAVDRVLFALYIVVLSAIHQA